MGRAGRPPGKPVAVITVRVRFDWSGQDRGQLYPSTHPTEFHVSPERYRRILDWQRHPAYEEIEYEAILKGGDPERPDPAKGRDIDDPSLANGARLQLDLWKRATRLFGGSPRPASTDFYELLVMIYEFRGGLLIDLEPLARAIRWNPKNDPDTLRRFKRWRESVRVQPGEPDQYMQLVLQALTLMKAPKGATTTERDRTPQAIRRGRRWITQEKRKLVPLELPIEKYIWWFRNEVTRIIKHEILPDYDDQMGGDAPLDGEGSEESTGTASAADKQQARRWRERASRDELHISHSDHVLDHPTKTSATLRAMAGRVTKGGVKTSKLQHQILELAVEDGHLSDYREIAERLGRGRDTVKNAIFRLSRKLAKL